MMGGASIASAGEISERILLVETLCDEFIGLLTCDPSLWHGLPWPFARISADMWQLIASSVSDHYRHLARTREERIASLPHDSVARSGKRTRVYMSFMREFSDTLRRKGVLLDAMPNPCSPLIKKRLWERQCCIQRRKLFMTVDEHCDGLAGATARIVLQHNFLFGRHGNLGDFSTSISHRLFRCLEAIHPFMCTLCEFPHLFWTLPVPFHVDQPLQVWQARLDASVLFMLLLQNKRHVQLEVALITWYWPDIAADLRLLDIVSTKCTSISKEHRQRQLASAISCLHVLCCISSLSGDEVLRRQSLLFQLVLPELRDVSAASFRVDSDVCGGSEANIRKRIGDNKEKARCRKMLKIVCWQDEGMQVPKRTDGVDGLIPYNYEYFQACIDVTTLAWLHPHSRDRHVSFEPICHEYFINGRKTNGSVTALVHHFSNPFDADFVIGRMVASARWPRAGYLRSECTPHVLDLVEEIDAEIASAFLQKPRNDVWICERLRCWPNCHAGLVDCLTKTKQEIKQMWEKNRDEAAAHGTYMHFLFEAYLNV